MEAQGAESSGCETTNACWWKAVPLPIMSEIRGAPLKWKLFVVRSYVERLGATDGFVACTDLILGDRASVTHSATCTQRMQEWLEKDEVGRVRLEMKPRSVLKSDFDRQRQAKGPCHRQKCAMSQYKSKLNPSSEQQTQPSRTLIHEWKEMKKLLMTM